MQDSSISKFERAHVLPGYSPGRVLIVGSRVYPGREDRRVGWRDALGVDMLAGPGVDRVLDLEELLPDDLGVFNHVECLSVLEHSRHPWLLAANIERLMAPGATIFIAVPLCWRLHAYPADYWRMSPAAVRSLFPAVTWDALMLAGERLHDGPGIPSVTVEGHPYMARTETVGFGRKL